MRRRGLTLIELLVVVAIISLLMGLSLPALVRIRNQAQSTVCIRNLKTLSLAWLLYKDDSDDRLVGGQVGKTSSDWVQGPTGAGTFIECKKEGIRKGALFRYVGNEVDVYRCPADHRKLVPGQIAFRSYSIAGGANGEPWQNTYIPVEKYSQLVQPATKYIFIEESDPRGWNKGSWVVDPLNKTWVDPLAVWHSRARSSLAFADGHAEIHHWVDSSTIEMSREQQFLTPVPKNEGNDLHFMLSGFPQRMTDGPVSP